MFSCKIPLQETKLKLNCTWEFPDRRGKAPALVTARGEYWLIGELSDEKEGVLEGAVDCGAYWKPGKPEKLYWFKGWYPLELAGNLQN